MAEHYLNMLGHGQTNKPMN